MRIFIYESVSAGELGDDVPASLLREGAAMLRAISADLERLPGIEVVTAKKVSAPLFDFALIIAPEFDDLLANHKFVVIPSAVSTSSWNLIFVAANAAGAYSVLAQEPFALDTRLHPPAR